MTAVAVFLKYPIPGKVKTRLAQKIGEKQAAILYTEMTRLVFNQCLEPLNPAKFARYLYCDPFLPLADYQTIFGETGFNLKSQSGVDLGDRLSQAFSTLLAGHESAIILGTDCIEMTADHLVESADYLGAKADLVLGPAEDGGYYLIAARKVHPELFAGIQWSTSHVFSRTVEEAEKLKLRIHILPTLSDIDTWEDLQKSRLNSFLKTLVTK